MTYAKLLTFLNHRGHRTKGFFLCCSYHLRYTFILIFKSFPSCMLIVRMYFFFSCYCLPCSNFKTSPPVRGSWWFLKILVSSGENWKTMVSRVFGYCWWSCHMVSLLRQSCHWVPSSWPVPRDLREGGRHLHRTQRSKKSFCIPFPPSGEIASISVLLVMETKLYDCCVYRRQLLPMHPAHCWGWVPLPCLILRSLSDTCFTKLHDGWLFCMWPATTMLDQLASSPWHY